MCQHTDPGMTLKHRDLIHSGRVATAIKSNKSSMLVHHEKSGVCDSFIVGSIHGVSENYYEEGTYALTYLNNIKFLLHVLIVLKLYLFYLPMLVGSCFHGLLAHKIPMHRK